MFQSAPLVFDSSTMLATILTDYIGERSPVDIATDGRIVNCALNATDALCSAAAAPAAPPSAAAAAAAGWRLAPLVAAVLAAILPA